LYTPPVPGQFPLVPGTNSSDSGPWNTLGSQKMDHSHEANPSQADSDHRNSPPRIIF
jgi:hypothetical protein